MKRLLILLTALGTSLATIAYERPVQLSELPEKAQQLIATHFAEHTLTHAIYDAEIADRSYDVYLSDGSRLKFGRKGDLYKIESPRGGSIPAGILPEGIERYVATNHPKARIVEAELDRRLWEVKLSGDIELVFDQKGRLKWYD